MKVRTPVVLQIENAECGAACLGIILAYHRRYVPLEELRIRCGVSRDGSKAINLVNAARHYGLKAKGYRANLRSLKELEFPFVVFWNSNHYVVVDGMGKRNVYINDPNTGPRKIPLDEFNNAFTGIALTFQKGTEFQSGGEKPRIDWVLLSKLKGNLVGLVFMVAATLVVAVPHTLSAVLSRTFTDQVLIQENTQWTIVIVGLMGLMSILASAALNLQSLSVLRLETKLAVTGSARYMWQLLRLPIEFYSQRSRGDIAARVQSNDKVAVLLAAEISRNIANLILVVAYAAVMFQYDRFLTAICLGMFALDLLVLKVATSKLLASVRRLVKATGMLNGVSAGGITSIETIKSIGDENDAFVQWQSYQAKHAAAEQERGRIAQTLAIFPSLCRQVSGIAVLSIGGLRVMDGLLSIGMLVALNELMAACMEPIEKVVELGVSLQDARVNQTRLNDTMRYPIAIRGRSSQDSFQEGSSSEPLRGMIELESVEFGFSTLDPPIVSNVNLKAYPGQRIAIVGPSGSGKTTIAKIVAGLYKPTAGSVRFDGVPIDAVQSDVLVNSVSFVDQDIALFQGTVRDNLCVWDHSIPMEAMMEAAQDACIDQLIAELGNGYESMIDEDGRNLSGGQRQRLEIARALSSRPSILILDEATSALDAHVEEQIMERLRRRGITCLIMAHRLSTVKDCDEIIVLWRGNVVERGTHDSLIRARGRYARLVAAE